MFNVSFEIAEVGKKSPAIFRKGTLIITINPEVKGRDSASGKSTVIASTEGNVSVPGTDLTLGLNLYRKK